jgi:hypothetical protein
MKTAKKFVSCSSLREKIEDAFLRHWCVSWSSLLLTYRLPCIVLVHKSLSRLVARCNDTVIYAVGRDVTRRSTLRGGSRLKHLIQRDSCLASNLVMGAPPPPQTRRPRLPWCRRRQGSRRLHSEGHRLDSSGRIRVRWVMRETRNNIDPM